MTTTKNLGYLNFSRAIKNYICIARRAIIEKIIKAQTANNTTQNNNIQIKMKHIFHYLSIERRLVGLPH